MSHANESVSLCHAQPLDLNDSICNGPLALVVAKLFFPLALSMVLSSTIGIVDMYIAGFLGSNAQAAVGLGDQLLFLLIVLGSGLATACSSFISRAAGAKDLEACRLFADASLVLALGVGLVASILGIFFAQSLLQALACDPGVAALAVPYTVYNAPANAPFIFCICLCAIFRALGRPLLAVQLWFFIAGLTNLLVLVLFFSGIPEAHSLNALAVAWDIGCFAGAFAGYVLFRRMIASADGAGRSATALAERYRALLAAIKSLVAVGLPAVVSELALLIFQFIMYRMLSSSADAAVLQAAWTIKLKLEESIALIPLLALGMTTGVIVGQNLGAGRHQHASAACMKIAVFAFASMLAVGAALTYFAPNLAELFSADPLTRQSVVGLLLPSVLLLPLTAISSIFCAGLEGAGLTKVPMALSILFQVLGRSSLSYFFGLQESVSLEGIGLGLCIAQFLMVIATLLYVKNSGIARQCNIVFPTTQR